MRLNKKKKQMPKKKNIHDSTVGPDDQRTIIAAFQIGYNFGKLKWEIINQYFGRTGITKDDCEPDIGDFSEQILERINTTRISDRVRNYVQQKEKQWLDEPEWQYYLRIVDDYYSQLTTTAYDIISPIELIDSLLQILQVPLSQPRKEKFQNAFFDLFLSERAMNLAQSNVLVIELSDCTELATFLRTTKKILLSNPLNQSSTLLKDTVEMGEIIFDTEDLQSRGRRFPTDCTFHVPLKPEIIAEWMDITTIRKPDGNPLEMLHFTHTNSTHSGQLKSWWEENKSILLNLKQNIRPLIKWNKTEGKLKIRTIEISFQVKKALAIVVLLDSFEAVNWSEELTIPVLPNEILDDRAKKISNAIYQLQRKTGVNGLKFKRRVNHVERTIVVSFQLEDY
ncbi:MAG: hypothetical protein R3B84_16285 [Zavarzinella sp.]